MLTTTLDTPMDEIKEPLMFMIELLNKFSNFSFLSCLKISVLDISPCVGGEIVMREGTFLAARAASLTCFQSFRGSASKTIQHLQANLHLPLNLASYAGYHLTRLMVHHKVNITGR